MVSQAENWKLLQTIGVPLLHVFTTRLCYTSFLHVFAARLHYTSLLHVLTARLCCTSLLHVFTATCWGSSAVVCGAERGSVCVDRFKKQNSKQTKHKQSGDKPLGTLVDGDVVSAVEFDEQVPECASCRVDANLLHVLTTRLCYAS